MFKLIVGFTLLFLGLSILSGVMDGAAGVSSTNLTAAIDEDDLVIPVTDTTGFLASGGVIMIGAEKIEYDSLTAPPGATFIVDNVEDRGVEKTKAEAHADDSAVYSEALGVLNAALGFRIVGATTLGGTVDVLSAAASFVTVTIPRIISWDYSFLQGDLLILRYILMTLSIGFVVYLSYMAINTVFGILGKAV